MIEPRVLLSTRVKKKAMVLLKRAARKADVTPSAYAAKIIEQYVLPPAANGSDK